MLFILILKILGILQFLTNGFNLIASRKMFGRKASQKIPFCVCVRKNETFSVKWVVLPGMAPKTFLRSTAFFFFRMVPLPKKRSTMKHNQV